MSRPWPKLGVTGAVPSESTFRRTLQRLDADAFDDLAGTWAAQRTAPGPRRRRVIAVDGKTLRGSGHGGEGRHLLAALDHAHGAVLGQVEVGEKTNEVRHEALCRIPGSAGKNSEGGSWARWLTPKRKPTGTRACHGNLWPCPEDQERCTRETRVIWRKLDCLNPNLQDASRTHGRDL